MGVDPWIDGALRRLSPAVRERFRDEPRATMIEDLGMRVRAVDAPAQARDDGGICDGTSYLDDGVVLYVHTPHSRRENFTLAHELGHWLVERDQRFFNWIADQNNAGQLMESACDRIAQRLLLPDETTISVIGEGPVRAKHVLELYDRSQASVPACAISISRRLPGLGAVVLIDRRAGVVFHASIRPDDDEGWPAVFPWRDQPVDEAHALMNIASGGNLTRRIWWRAPWGSQVEFFADAVADERRVIAVFSASDLWAVEPGRVLQPREFDQRPLGTIYCCGQERLVRGYPCPKCREQFCPVCHRCKCDRNAASEVQCTKCFLVKNASLVVGGLCDTCR